MSRVFGLTLIGSLFVFSGGLTILMIVIDIIDSIAKFGWGSVAVKNLISLQGLLRHLVLPVLLYNVGIGLLLKESWARKITVYVLPFMFMFFLANERTLLLWIFLVFVLVFYFTRPEIKKHFGPAVRVDNL